MGMPTYEITTTPHITPAVVGRETLPAGPPSNHAVVLQFHSYKVITAAKPARRHIGYILCPD